MNRTAWRRAAAGLLLLGISFAQAGENAVLCASGRVEPNGEERRLAFSVTGLLANVAVKEGQTVKAGETLATLDNAEEKAAVELAAAEAALAAAEAARARAALDKVKNGARPEERQAAEADAAGAKAALERIENGSRPAEKTAAQAALARRKAERENAERQAERLRKLRAGNAASQEEMENAEDALTVAKAAEAEAEAAAALVVDPARAEDVAAARARSEAAAARAALVKADARAEDVAIAQAELDAAEARRQAAESRKAQAESRLAKTVLRAPSAGTILKLYRREGETVNGETALILGDLSSLRVRVEVDETDVAKVREGQEVRVRVPGAAETSLRGKVAQKGGLMGRKRLFSESPKEKQDTQVLEALVDLEGAPALPVGLRVDVYFEK